jgi:hypothetical protein
MNCPECNQAISDPWTLANGTHHEVPCRCGADLQWDQQITSNSRPGHVQMGPPEACRHPEARPGVKIPRSAST